MFSKCEKYNSMHMCKYLGIFTSNSACQIIDNLTCTRGYFGRLFPEKNLHDK
jgi:hypothetical protein